MAITNIDATKLKLDNFVNGSFHLKGKYPDIPPEVMAVFFGMYDGKITQYDISIDSLQVAIKVWDAWYKYLPSTISIPLYWYCIGYMLDKSDDIYDIIGDTKVFELPKLETPSLDLPQFKLHKPKLDDIIKKLKKDLKKLWPDDEKGEKQKKHAKQTNNLSKLEKELKKVMDFAKNPNGPLDTEFSRIGKQIKDMINKMNAFLDKIDEAARRLRNLDFPSLAALSDSIFLEMTTKLEQAIKSCCDAMISSYKKQIKAMPFPPETWDQMKDMARMGQLIDQLNKLKENIKPFKDYVNEYIRKKDIEALSVSVKNQKYIDELSKISIQYQNEKYNIEQKMENVEATALLTALKTLAVIEAKRYCNCIRIFDKIKSVDDGLKDIYLEAVRKYVEANYPLMTKAEQNMFVNCLAKKTPTQSSFQNTTGIDRLTSLFTDVKNEASEDIKQTKSSESTKMRN